MEILHKIKIVLLSFSLMLVVSCRNTTQIKVTSNNDKVLQSLPDEIANKTWIFIHDTPEDEKYNTYKNIITYEADGAVKTKKNVFFTVLDIYETYFFEIEFDTVIVEKDVYIIQFNHPEIDYAKFKWIDKKKGIGEWKIRYLRYRDGFESIQTFRCVDENFVTPENFPEPAPEKIVLEKKNEIDLNIYSELIDDLPIEGKFRCTYKNERGNNVYGAYLSISNKDFEDKNTITKIVEKYKNYFAIRLDEASNLQCDARKIRGSSDKYALFYKEYVSEYSPPKESLNYSKTLPIAEIEILDNNTIKKKWLGIYNRRTKKTEEIPGFFNWYDKECDKMKRIE